MGSSYCWSQSCSLLKMKTQMSKVLALGFSLMLSLAAVGGLKCHHCVKVRKDNTCVKKHFCDVAGRNFCYIQRVSKGGHIRRVHRGCTTFCIQAVKLSMDFIKYTFCCQTDYCNKNNIWQLY
ncbi:protein PIP-1-like [Rhineura floridana]|uniref:protein PIP-1-like n=1 Tax=Rhineura floridana TaxID=261503 RepID=UPI002AC89325|nr:protein PIP-1-like [Rhineura floridana]